MKRVMDLTVAVLGLLLLSPLMLAAAVWIKFDSPGPVFFRQTRVGRHGTLFRIHKFRSMTGMPSEAFDVQLTVGDDDRLTRAGVVLRRFKVDELPQLLDVLSGKMSLVGPRPEVPRYLAYYPPGVRNEVLSVRPGITDLAAIEFRNESRLLAAVADPETYYIREILPRKLGLYVQYVRTQTLSEDCRIILRTLVAVIRNG